MGCVREGRWNSLLVTLWHRDLCVMVWSARSSSSDDLRPFCARRWPLSETIISHYTQWSEKTTNCRRLDFVVLCWGTAARGRVAWCHCSSWSCTWRGRVRGVVSPQLVTMYVAWCHCTHDTAITMKYIRRITNSLGHVVVRFVRRRTRQSDITIYSRSDVGLINVADGRIYCYPPFAR